MRLATLLLTVLLVAIPATAGDSPGKQSPVADSSLAFGLDLCKALRSSDRNVIVSPYSISTVLAMVGCGARGRTAEEIRRVLHLPSGTDLRGLGRSWTTIAPRRAVSDRPHTAPVVRDFRVYGANAVWMAKSFRLANSEFPATLRGAFRASLERTDFGKPVEAAKRINLWVKKHTAGRIPSIVDSRSVSQETRLILANAVFFKASWAHPFEKDSTKVGPFYASGAKAVQTKMMCTSASLRYAENDQAQVVEIPYRGEKASMVVVLPREKRGLPALMRSLDAPKINKWIRSGSRRMVAVRLPMFQSQFATDLTKILQRLGLRAAFTVQADFTGISQGKPLSISGVVHKAMIDVDESGTEAAAATATTFFTGKKYPDPQESFAADHPFLFLIRHVKTGTILFIGCVQDPTKGA